VAMRLAPGASAHAWLKVTVAANYSASSCQPFTDHWLRIYPRARPCPATWSTTPAPAPPRACQC
jgi:hypothetical protein